MAKYKKAPAYEGKHLSLHIGPADRTIRDGEIVEGPAFAQFVGLGFLVRVEEDAPTPAPAPAPPPKAVVPQPKAPEPEPEPEPEVPETKTSSAKPPEPEGGTTKSTAEKMSKGSRSKRRK